MTRQRKRDLEFLAAYRKAQAAEPYLFAIWGASVLAIVVVPVLAFLP